MRRKHFRVKRLVFGLAFGLAVAGFSAPALQASGGSGPLDPWAYAVIHRSAQTTVMPAGTSGPLDPWAYAVIHRSTQSTVAPAGETLARTIRGPSPSPAGTQADRLTSQPGFNWGDAGIGASVSFGAALVLVTALGLGGRHRSRIDRSGFATS